MRAAVAGGLLLVGVAGCDDHIVGQGVPIVNTCTREPALTYENAGEGLVERHCRSCHGEFLVGDDRAGAPDEVNLDSEQDVLDHANAIYAQVVLDQTMPPAGGMLEEERTRMEEWLRCDVLPRVGQVDFVGEAGGDQ